MIAVLEFIDGFGADTNVIGIYKNLEEAAFSHGDNFRYKTFEFGRVEFDIYECETFSKSFSIPTITAMKPCGLTYKRKAQFLQIE